MNIFEFDPIQESIIASKRHKFVSHYCILTSIGLLPELINIILNFEMHGMKQRLHDLIEDKKLLLSMMIILAKGYKVIKMEPCVIFSNDKIENNYGTNALECAKNHQTMLTKNIIVYLFDILVKNDFIIYIYE